MIIYIEIVLIVNLLLHIFTIILIKELLYLRIKKMFILSIFLDVVYMLFYLYKYEVSYVKYILPFLFIFLSFKADMYSYLKAVLIYFLFSYLLGGISFTLNVSGNYKYYCIFFITFILFIIIYFSFKRRYVNTYYQISFILKNKKYKINAFYDTGSNLLYKGYPVIILHKKYHFNIYSDSYLILYTANGKSVEIVYLINSLAIGKKEIKCYCIFLDIAYDAIIGCNVL